MRSLKRQVGGNHYSKMKIQPMEFCHRNKFTLLEGSIIKYVSRWRTKNGLEDLKKAHHCTEILIDLETGKDKIVSVIVEYFRDLFFGRKFEIMPEDYVEQNEFEDDEADVILHISYWRAFQYCENRLFLLYRTLGILTTMIDREYALQEKEELKK